MKKVMHIAIFSREIKKLVEFRLPAILVVSLAWLALPITAGGKARATRATTAKEVSLAATAQL